MRELAQRLFLSLWCSAAGLISVGVLLHSAHKLWELLREGEALGVFGLFFSLLLCLSLALTGLFARVIFVARYGVVSPRLGRYCLLLGLPFLALALWSILR